MPFDLLLAFISFAFVTSITPGPNNLMLMASGANFGMRRTVPHMLGVALGFTALIIVVGLGLAQIFDAYPVSRTGLQVVSIAYMLWLAWKIANAAPPEEREATGNPMTFMQAAAFQWVNPKGWAMALSAVAVYAPDRTFAVILLVAAVFGAINLPAVSSWAWLGERLRYVLTNTARLRIFNWTMAALLVASLYPVLVP